MSDDFMWSVRLVYSSDAPPTEDQTVQLYEQLSEFAPGIGLTGNGQLEFQLAVHAATPVEAITYGWETTAKVAQLTGMTGITILEMETLGWEEFERRLELPPRT